VTGASRGLGRPSLFLSLRRVPRSCARVRLRAARHRPSTPFARMAGTRSRSTAISPTWLTWRASSSPSMIVGQIDILVNNAGTIRRHPAHEFPDADWQAVIDTNLNSVFALSALRRSDEGAGSVVRSSISLRFSLFRGELPFRPTRRASTLSRDSRRRLPTNGRRHNVQVNAIAPGYFATDNTAALQADPVRSEQILTRIPAGRWGSPDDLGGAAVFLAFVSELTTSTATFSSWMEAGSRAEREGSPPRSVG
jgi:2-dehydro-3-deoxy-D-gluconate 5-dehydrogenase